LLDRLYAQSARVRRHWYERHPNARRRLWQPVVSIGNLTVGGSAKTPLVSRVAAYLLDRGERPAILSRGYARVDPVDGVVVVSDGARVLVPLARAGDEPLMLARQLPKAVVAVAEDRHLAGVVAERQLGATVHVLDDGFQHVQLARDLDVLVTQPGEIASGRTLPFGRLREEAAAAARADVVVVLDADLAAARQEAFELGVSQVVAARKVLPQGSAAFGASPESRLVAVAGIARPEQFFAMLREAGHTLVETLAFADHHSYSRRDVSRIAAAVTASNAAGVITTEKDAVRFEPLAPLPFALAVASLDLQFDGWDTLAACIDAAVSRRRDERRGVWHGPAGS
jgi:tetraacyldisaccharide 4'-kinase